MSCFKMHPEEAKRRFQEGAVFMLLDVPEGTEFGIDLKSWDVGEKFRGIKMIPPGVHYIYYSASNNYEETSFRSGFFYNFRQGEFIVKRWDRKMEEISSDEVSESEIVQFKENIVALDSFLGPYPYEILDKWQESICYLTDDLVKKISPSCGYIHSAMELEPSPNTNSIENPGPSTSKFNSADVFKSMQPKDGSYLRLSKLPEKNYPEGSTPAEITRHSMDLSYVLEVLLSQHEREEDLLGELQFSYIIFLVGYSFEAFEHWKQLINVFCSCVAAIDEHNNLFKEFISVVQMQLSEVTEDTFGDILHEDNFLYSKIRNFLSNVLLYDTSGSLVDKAMRLKVKLSQKYGWVFENLRQEDADDAPVVVSIE